MIICRIHQRTFVDILQIASSDPEINSWSKKNWDKATNWADYFEKIFETLPEEAEVIAGNALQKTIGEIPPWASWERWECAGHVLLRGWLYNPFLRGPLPVERLLRGYLKRALAHTPNLPPTRLPRSQWREAMQTFRKDLRRRTKTQARVYALQRVTQLLRPTAPPLYSPTTFTLSDSHSFTVSDSHSFTVSDSHESREVKAEQWSDAVSSKATLRAVAAVLARSSPRLDQLSKLTSPSISALTGWAALGETFPSIEALPSGHPSTPRGHSAEWHRLLHTSQMLPMIPAPVLATLALRGDLRAILSALVRKLYEKETPNSTPSLLSSSSQVKTQLAYLAQRHPKLLRSVECLLPLLSKELSQTSEN